MKKLRVTVDGKAYEVLVEMLDESPAPVRALAAPSAPAVAAPTVAPAPVSPVIAAPSAPSTPVAGSGSVASPLAGKVVSIDVKVGEAVAEGAQLVTLEAMKMNTFVYAPRAGQVAAVHAAAGDAVEEGAPLLTMR
jgi:biotin carboxyl carrier protein